MKWKKKKYYYFTNEFRSRYDNIYSRHYCRLCRRRIVGGCLYINTFTPFDDAHPYFVHYILYYRDMSIAIGNNNNNILLSNLHCFGGSLIRHLSRPAAPSALQRAHILLFYIVWTYILYYVFWNLFSRQGCAPSFLAPSFCCPNI